MPHQSGRLNLIAGLMLRENSIDETNVRHGVAGLLQISEAIPEGFDESRRIFSRTVHRIGETAPRPIKAATTTGTGKARLAFFDRPPYIALHSDFSN